MTTVDEGIGMYTLVPPGSLRQCLVYSTVASNSEDHSSEHSDEWAGDSDSKESAPPLLVQFCPRWEVREQLSKLFERCEVCLL
jgi:hypothetical protein